VQNYYHFDEKVNTRNVKVFDFFAKLKIKVKSKKVSQQCQTTFNKGRKLNKGIQLK
jgi:hypothetical protein